MLVHRLALRCLVFAFVASGFFTVYLVSRPVGTEAPQPPSIPENAQQVALTNEGRTSNASVPRASPVPGETSQQTGDETDCEDLPRDHPLRLRLNGRRLPLDYHALQKGSRRIMLRESKVLPLSDGRLLAGLGDTLYMLTAGRRIKWKYTPSWMVVDFAIVESTGLIYGSAGDGVMFVLDASNGQVLHTHFLNGRFNYQQVARFGKDMCLVTLSTAGYRENLDEWKWATESGKIEVIEQDEITAWRGTEPVWSADFPPDAELIVRGDKIYAVTKTDKSIYFREIVPPKSN